MSTSFTTSPSPQKSSTKNAHFTFKIHATPPTEKAAERKRQFSSLKKGGPQEYDKPWRQTFKKETYSKENKTLKPYLRKYNNVDENVLAVRSQNQSYQLVHEHDQDEIFKDFYNVSSSFCSFARASPPNLFVLLLPSVRRN